MKIQPDSSNAQSISGYGSGWVSIGQEKITTSLVIGSRGERFEWLCEKYEDLGEEHFLLLSKMNTELVIFGSGQRLRFPKASWLKPLVDKQIGLESMDTQAACRTYNILASEGRHVALALILEHSS